MARLTTRRILARPVAYRSAFALSKPFLTQVRCDSSLPSVAQASFWSSLIPKPLRKENREARKGKTKPKEWNPATFFIIVFLLIGSMSINTIAVRTGHANFVRQADTRIGLLRDIVERLQKGEQVDVEKELMAGDPAEEKAWGEVLREIEINDGLQDPPKQKKSRKPRPTEAPKSENTANPAPSEPTAITSAKPSKISSSSFY